LIKIYEDIAFKCGEGKLMKMWRFGDSLID